MLPAALNPQRDCKYQRREEFERRTRADVESAAVALSKTSTGVAFEGGFGATQLPRSSTSASAKASECVIVRSEDRAPIAANRRPAPP